MEVQGITHSDESGVWVEATDPPAGNNVDWVGIFRVIDEYMYQLVEQFLNPTRLCRWKKVISLSIVLVVTFTFEKLLFKK